MVKDEWFSDPFVIKIINSIDKADVIAPNVIKDRVSGRVLPASVLSSGAKFLILLHRTRNLLYLATMGDNCCDLFEQIVLEYEKGAGICL